MARKSCLNDNTFKSSLAARMRAQLQKQKMTNASLSRQVGVSTAAISQFVTGESMPSLNTLAKLAVALDVSADYLLGLSDVTRPDAPDITIQQIENYTGLSGDQIVSLAENRLTDEDKVLVWEFMQLLVRKNAAIEKGD